ncbi:MAG: sensor histidine kinase [Hyphomicrobiaceae bacterium]|nr:sensor histidine kinase [Hyphomicrobiaceae bacterium]
MPTETASLYWRLTGLIAAVIAVVGAVLMVAALRSARTAADDAYDRVLVGVALQIAETIGAEDGVVSVDVSMAALEALSVSKSDRIFYHVLGTDGASITGYDGLKFTGRAGAGIGPFTETGSVDGVAVRIAMVRRWVSDAARPGFVTTLVAHTLDARTALAHDLAGKAFLLVVVMSGLALGGVMVAVRLAFRPLRRVERALLARDPADLSPLTVATPREIGTLVGSINQFMLRLSDRLNLLQQHVGDVAHQIRTPLTALAAQIELAAHDTDPDKRTARLERIAGRVNELSRLTHQLLSHAMVLHRAEARAREPVDLREVAAEVSRLSLPEDSERRIDVRIDLAEDPVMVAGDRVSLVEAVKNLVDNALRHGAPTRLAIRVEHDDGDAVVSVLDDGPGIEAAEQARATERFARGAGAGAGSGLGLAIVKDVIVAHDGRLSFGRDGGGDFRVSMHLGALPCPDKAEVE